MYDIPTWYNAKARWVGLGATEKDLLIGNSSNGVGGILGKTRCTPSMIKSNKPIICALTPVPTLSEI
jgi:hypothetical protein